VRVLLINDSSSNPNWGDRAASYSLQAMIQAVGGEISSSVSELALGTSTFGRPSPTPQVTASHHGIGSLLARCVPPLLYPVARPVAHALATHSPDRIPVSWQGFERAAGHFADRAGPWADFLDAVSEADVVVVHGDGCMTGNGLIARTELLIAYVIKTRLARPVIIVNHTGDFSEPALRRIAEEVYPLFDDVVFREPASVEACRDFVAGRFAPDSAFLFDPMLREEWTAVAGRPGYFDVWPDAARFDPGRPYLCVGGSSVFATRDAGATLVAHYRELILHLASVYPGQVVLTVSDLVDEPVLRKVAEELRLPLVALTTPVRQAADILGHADCYVGGRWHAAIFALSGGAPVVPLSAKTFKMQALMQMAGLPAAPVDAWALKEHRTNVGRLVQDCIEQGDGLRDNLRDWARAQAEAAWGNVTFLKEWGAG
jgi:polysaccharide pyruvyl transferase WcaK-like protein